MSTCNNLGTHSTTWILFYPIPAADDPAPVLDTFKLYLRGQGVNPYTRQQKSRQINASKPHSKSFNA